MKYGVGAANGAARAKNGAASNGAVATAGANGAAKGAGANGAANGAGTGKGAGAAARNGAAATGAAASGVVIGVATAWFTVCALYDEATGKTTFPNAAEKHMANTVKI